ncbi:NAD(P)H-dependent oxidoreductase, partial [Dorea formicigenerans]|uniref:NAD(P)H-dependent oxidoreductase n=1 Tax=Dorea formicigenerans TaxID=39486 RepID=UPI001EE08341
EQYDAARTGAFAADVRTEIDHLLAADLVILQFPLYWFSVPAIMKGWIDRVFANGIIYGDGRWYDRGALGGK